MATLTISTEPTPAGELPDMPIEPSWIKSGNPVARGTVIAQSADKKVSSGLWSCEPGEFEWHFAWDEFVHVLEGEAEITEIGTDNTITLGPGDMTHFPLGLKAHWRVKSKIRKFFTVRTPEPLVL